MGNLKKTDAKIGIITVSDRAFHGVYPDHGGPAVENALNEILLSPWKAHYVLISDDRDKIADLLKHCVDEEKCDLIFTTGGTGPALRDVTPEATEEVCDKLMPGFGELMRFKSLEQTPTAILSRQIAGIRGQCLIINLPGKPSAIKHCMLAVFQAVPYCLDLIGAARLETDETICKAFRPAF
jgi:molybdopterin adenylyltransferase